jgi:hypothetical protein
MEGELLWLEPTIPKTNLIERLNPKGQPDRPAPKSRTNA